MVIYQNMAAALISWLLYECFRIICRFCNQLLVWALDFYCNRLNSFIHAHKFSSKLVLLYPWCSKCLNSH